MMSLYGRKRVGFTLIELLVVIAVIALLLGILLPVLSVSKERARRVVCAGNVKQFHVGISVYAENHDSWVPSGMSDATDPLEEHTPLISRKVGDLMAEILGGHKVMKCQWLGKPFDGEEWWYYSESNVSGYVLGYNYLGGHKGTPWALTGPAVKEWKSPKFSSDRGDLAVITELNFWVPPAGNGRTFAPHGSRGTISDYHEEGTGGMTAAEAGAKGGNVGLMDGSVS